MGRNPVGQAELRPDGWVAARLLFIRFGTASSPVDAGTVLRAWISSGVCGPLDDQSIGLGRWCRMSRTLRSTVDRAGPIQNGFLVGRVSPSGLVPIGGNSLRSGGLLHRRGICFLREAYLGGVAGLRTGCRYLGCFRLSGLAILEERRPRGELKFDDPGAFRLQDVPGFVNFTDGSHVKRARG